MSTREEQEPSEWLQGMLVEDGTCKNNRRAKLYRLTVKGRKRLAVETSEWEKIAGAIAQILRPTEKPQ